MFAGGATWWRGGGKANDDAKRRFGEAVDLYYSGRFAEALAIFNGLARDFPQNPDIQNGRIQCERALKRPGAGRRLALEDKSEKLKDAVLDKETVKRIVLEKLVAGSSDAIQLQAAAIAAKILGMYDGAESDASGDEDTIDTDALETGDGAAKAKEAPFTISAFRDYSSGETHEADEESHDDLAEDDDVASSDVQRA